MLSSLSYNERRLPMDHMVSFYLLHKFSLLLFSLVFIHPTNSTQMIHKICLKVMHGRLYLAFMIKPGQELTDDITEEEDNAPPKTRKEQGKSQSEEKRKNSRKLCLCPIRKGKEACNFQKLSNNTALHNHKCPLLDSVAITQIFNPAPDSFSLFTSLAPNISTSQEKVERMGTELIVWLTAQAGLSYSFVSGAKFETFARGLVKVGQEHQSMPVEQIIPHLSRQQLKVLTERQAAQIFVNFYRKYTNRYVNVLFDCGKIAHHNYCAICVCGYGSTERPTFFQFAIAPSTKNDYILFYNQLLSNFQKWNIHVGTVCTDGLTAQVNAVYDCHKRMREGLPVGSFIPSLIPKHVPCLNHRINNVVQSVLSNNPFVAPRRLAIMEFLSRANTKEIQEILKEHSPVFIETRWLSLQCIFSYIRTHRKELLLYNLIDPQLIVDCLYLEILITPLMELHLFFEMHSTKISHAYPAVVRALYQYFELSRLVPFCTGEWLHVLTEFTIQLFIKTLNSSMRNLLLLSFIYSDIGRFFWLRKEFPIGFNPNFNLSSVIDRLEMIDINDAFVFHSH